MTDLPEKIGRYVIAEKLGQGPHGEVFKAWDTSQNRTIALKWLYEGFSEGNSFRGHDLGVINTIARAGIPQACAVSGVEEVDNRFLVVMEHIEGRPVNEVLAGSNLDNEQFLIIAEQIVEGLKGIHDLKVAHGNIKSSNIIITDDGGVRLIDYGLPVEFDLEKINDEDPFEESLLYLPPEILNGEGASRSSDLYSLGMVFYKLLFSRAPFQVQTNSQLIKAIVHSSGNFEQPGQVKIPGDTILMIEKLLSKKPEERFTSSGELLITLNEMTRFHRSKISRDTPREKHPSPRSYLLVSFLTVLAILLWMYVASHLK